MSNFQVLDCTLRDGGYYTDWFFSRDLVVRYYQAIAETPVSALEIGYLSPIKPGSSGPYFYLGRNEIDLAREILPADRQIAVMMNYKDVSTEVASKLLRGIGDAVDIVRFACPPTEVASCIEIAKVVKDHGIKAAINIMYLSKYVKDAEPIMAPLAQQADAVDYVSLVDSYGSCFPDDVAQAVRKTVSMLPQPIGFHGHDNIGLAFANALASLGAGAQIVDSTMLGMGRGAGNLRTELMIAYMARGQQDISFGALADSLSDFERLWREYEWGSNLPYMISGFNSLPQADVMDWLGTRRYSISSIVSALQGAGNAKLEATKADSLGASAFGAQAGGKPAIIIGGGDTVVEHRDAIVALAERAGASIILSSLRHARLFADTKVALVACLPGEEALRRRQQLGTGDNLCFVVTSKPRLKGSNPGVSPCYLVGEWAQRKAVQLGPVSDVAPLELALGAALEIKATEVWLAGFDGYPHASLADQANANEVQAQIDIFVAESSRPALQSITPTLYKISQKPLYGLLSKFSSAS